MGKGNKQYYEFSNYIEETNNEHDSKNKIKIFIIVVILILFIGLILIAMNVKQTIDNGNAQTQQALALNASIQKSFDSYMSAWESRQKSYDIMSQKQSDATLGYERVYDTDTGDIYKAYNGFTDDYKCERYKSITDNMYTEKTSGYIEK